MAHHRILGMHWCISFAGKLYLPDNKIINTSLQNHSGFLLKSCVQLKLHARITTRLQWVTFGFLFCVPQTFLTQALGILIQMHLMSITVLTRLFMVWSLTLYLMSKEQSWSVICHQTSCPDLSMFPRYGIGHSGCTKHFHTSVHRMHFEMWMGRHAEQWK